MDGTGPPRGLANERRAGWLVVEIDALLILAGDLPLMLSDYPYAPSLSLADRLRLIADGVPVHSLEYRTLQQAADLLEDFD